MRESLARDQGFGDALDEDSLGVNQLARTFECGTNHLVDFGNNIARICRDAFAFA
jgi:hypothetical protein